MHLVQETQVQVKLPGACRRTPFDGVQDTPAPAIILTRAAYHDMLLPVRVGILYAWSSLSSSSTSLPTRCHRRSWRGGAEAGDERLLAAPPLCFPVDGQVVQGQGPRALAREQGE